MLSRSTINPSLSTSLNCSQIGNFRGVQNFSELFGWCVSEQRNVPNDGGVLGR